ncbi:cell surface glycoprotein CD200 receptor 1-A-like [Hyla sarda]|uniref:cell surface glycoprotein CD200 receptor 1-A-like n=1 Tax=Hyla sarda TaxID=327740 RepID=UPI0024C405BF|nr:cell surface glycoprotein CD200 receptor 1-A-like [Hyla sarda]
MNMFLLLLTVSVFSAIVSGADGVTVIRGRPAVLQCEADPGDTLLQVIWKLHLYNSSCLISYKIEENNTKISYSSCSTRMRSDDLSLRINNTEVSDEGEYRCEVVNSMRTFFTNISLHVLAQPSTYLKLNSDGSPECGAIGGNPPAHISWIPHSDDINTTVVEEPDRTRSVISIFWRKEMNETLMTCVVSHPTFAHPWKEFIVLNNWNKWKYKVLACVIICFIIILTCLIIWKLTDLRACFRNMINRDRKRNYCEEDRQEFEPYETFTQNDNVIYCVATFVAHETAS